jgi:putative DNA primase/helicase
MRYHSPVDWKGIDEPCPIWEKTLDGILDGDWKMIEYIQRLFGYAATGHVTENKLPLFVGAEAQNGKTTIFETKRKVLGNDLCVSIPMKTLMKSAFDTDGNKPDPYLVTLKNKRLAYSSESAKGMKLDTAIIKKLTGGDTLNPRGMYEKVGKGFTPTHKLMLFTNDRPIVPPDDAGAWERIHLIELNITFKDNPTKPNERQKDKDLGEKLKAEYSGILAWLVRGCLEWRKQGLNPPAKVLNATAAYRDDEDILSDFIEDACILGAGVGYEVKVMNIFGRHVGWCNKFGITPLDLREFKKQMKRKFGEPIKKNTGYFYQGIR